MPPIHPIDIFWAALLFWLPWQVYDYLKEVLWTRRIKSSTLMASVRSRGFTTRPGARAECASCTTRPIITCAVGRCYGAATEGQGSSSGSANTYAVILIPTSLHTGKNLV
jgi:hypothetical protein